MLRHRNLLENFMKKSQPQYIALYILLFSRLSITYLLLLRLPTHKHKPSTNHS